MKMPVMFVGHGNPMYTLMDNEFTKEWKKLGKEIPKPKAILCISAHWETNGTYITGMEKPETIHDFGGFPKELYEVEYPAPGNPELAKHIMNSIKGFKIEIDEKWGLDHGCWSVLRHMYPDADIPVIEMSIDYNKSLREHNELGKELSSLRKEGILVIGSGNIVHNLSLVNWKNENAKAEWAVTFNENVKKHLSNGSGEALINTRELGKEFQLAAPTLEHYIPLLYVMGVKNKSESVSFFNDKIVMGSLSMTSIITINN